MRDRLGGRIVRVPRRLHRRGRQGIQQLTVLVNWDRISRLCHTPIIALIGEVHHMLIGHTGRTRVIEVILAVALLVIAVRTALPIGAPGVYGAVAVKVSFGALLAVPAVLALAARALACRRTAMFWVFVTYAYVGALVPIVDWTRFGTAAALFALAGISGYLYYVTARDIKWTQEPSARSSPPSEPA